MVAGGVSENRMPGPERMSIAERLERNSVPEPMSGCVLWTSVVINSGYGHMVVRDPATRRIYGRLPHRLAYELAHGPIPADREIDHVCRVRRCINPNHLKLATRAENLRRRLNVGRPRVGTAGKRP